MAERRQGHETPDEKPQAVSLETARELYERAYEGGKKE